MKNKINNEDNNKKKKTLIEKFRDLPIYFKILIILLLFSFIFLIIYLLIYIITKKAKLPQKPNNFNKAKIIYGKTFNIEENIFYGDYVNTRLDENENWEQWWERNKGKTRQEILFKPQIIGVTQKPTDTSIPKKLLSRYTLNGKIAVIDWYIEPPKNLENVAPEWNQNFIDKWVNDFTPDNVKNKTKITQDRYHGAAVNLLNAFEKYNIRNKNIAIIGSETPWIESILLNMNNNVTTVEYNVPKINTNYKLKSISYWDFEKSKKNYDCIVTFSSIEHSGLGRYGDPLDPEGDIKTMNAIYKNLKKGGFCIWGAPCGHDAIAWNAHRIYGKIRLKLIFKKFKELEWFGFDKNEILNRKLEKWGYQPVIVLKK